MDRMGFTPHTMEDNNGKPAYPSSGEMSEEDADGSVQLA